MDVTHGVHSSSGCLFPVALAVRGIFLSASANTARAWESREDVVGEGGGGGGFG
jgi:hypothetical protein